MTRAEALGWGRARLAASPSASPGPGQNAAQDPSPTPSLDASLILASILGLRREALLSSLNVYLEAAPLARFEKAISQRVEGKPVAYITHEKEFFGRSFFVNEDVLVPRPDTELLVELSLELGDRLAALRGRPPLIHECCVGSGAVALSVAAERPSWVLSASDLSAAALDVAARNALRLLPSEREGGKLGLFLADLLTPPLGAPAAIPAAAATPAALPAATATPAASPGVAISAANPVAVTPAAAAILATAPTPFDLILANPPYVESPLARELAERWGEPLVALDGGNDGLDLIRRLVLEAVARLAPGGCLLIEADGSQAAALRRLFAEAGLADARSERDLGGIERVTIGVQP